MSAILLFLSLTVVVGDGIKSSFLESGATARQGGYRPVRSELDQTADVVQVAPENLKAPKYGKLSFGEKDFAYILDEPADEPARLYVDSNADGDLTNDPETNWEARTEGEMTMYFGSAKIALNADQQGTINLYRFDPKDPNRQQLQNTVLYYADFGYEYEFQLDGNTFTSSVAGAPANNSVLAIDRDGNGSISSRLEIARVGTPFNFTGTSYVFAMKEGQLTLDVAAESVPQSPLPPDLSIGKPALQFTATTLAGETLDFPKAYAGKIVMLDFWATWCGPCIGEIPNMKRAYTDWHDKGFEILGISFDQEGMEEKLQSFLEENELPWAQVYEGKGWDTTIGLQHDVSGIPFVLLVDGDSGEILATARQLRGEGLSDFVGNALKKKFPDLQ